MFLLILFIDALWSNVAVELVFGLSVSLSY